MSGNVMKILKRVLFLGVMIAVTAFLSTDVNADDTLANYYFSELDGFVRENENDGTASFTDVVRLLMSGDVDGIFADAGARVKNIFLGELTDIKSQLVKIFAIALIGACLTSIAGVFKESSINEMGFYITFMAMTSLLLSCFYIAYNVAYEVVELVVDFVTCLIPTFLMSVSVCSGSASGVGFLSLILLVINIVNVVILKIFLPACVVYIIVSILGSIHKEEKLAYIASLIKSFINWGIKSLYAVVIGLNVIKGMILPVVDSLKETSFIKTMEAIPGVGDAISGTASVLIGTATLIKNCIGIAGVVMLIAYVMVPVVKLGTISVMIRLTNAAISPVVDKRIISVNQSAAEGIKLLLNIVFTTAILFLITIAVVSVSTNVNYYSGA